MPPSKTRFITACQQFLALGAVLAVLTPAASVISLDVVRETPEQAGPGATPTGTGGTDALTGALSAYTRANEKASTVPTAAVDPTVREVALTPPAHARTVPGGLQARTTYESGVGAEVTSLPQAVTGYGAVGVTWQPGEELAEDAISFEVRTATAGVWSDWSAMTYHDEHGPDPDSAEALKARPGTDEALVGDVDEVQVRSTTDAGLPADMRLAVIDPGEATATEPELPAIDTADTPAETDTEGEGLALRAMKLTAPQPTIYSRAQWGANEALRDKGSLHYGSVNGGFVHHTVNANDYTRDEVPAILRSIYAYHTQSRGWSDIGYNFLVDRFGRIWEGRYGGVDKAVVGAHTLGYNDYSFAMSAIGNYDITEPSNAMIQAYGALFAWKLSLSGVNAASTSQKIGSKYFQAISGHRDAGSTACPGKYLYAKIPQIRQLAAAAQAGTPATWTGRTLGSSLASTPSPDLIARRVSDGMGVVLPTGGLSGFSSGSKVSKGWAKSSTPVATPDVTGDGVADLLVVAGDGSARIRPGNGAGKFGAAKKKTSVFRGHDLITAVGDLDGDKKNDFVARVRGTGTLDLLRGGGKGGFKRQKLGNGWAGYTAIVATGDVTGDGRADLMGRDKKGKLQLFAGTGRTKLKSRVTLRGSWGAYDTITGFGDFNGDGRNDLFVRRQGNQQAFLLPGRGNGTFGPRVGPFGQFKGFTSISGGGSVSGNGAPDLLARSGKKLTAFTNAGTFDLGAPIETGLSLADSSLALNAGDWDLDGLGDVITRATADGALYLHRGDGQGHFGPAIKIGNGFGAITSLVAIGDLNGDGFPDLIGTPPGGTMMVYPGKGSGLIGAAAPSPNAGVAAGAAAIGLDLSGYDWVVEVSDLDGDGRTDLLVRGSADGRLYALRSTGGTFSSRWYLGEGLKAYDLVG